MKVRVIPKRNGHANAKERRLTAQIHFPNGKSVPCQPIDLQISHVRQKNICGCGLAALEMVLKYYGASETQTDFLIDRRIKRQVESARRGLSEGTIGTLALKRGFKAVIYGEKPRLTKAFFQLGGKVEKVKTDKQLIINCLRQGVPPIVLIQKVSEAYEQRLEEIGHYVVVSGVDSRYQLQVVDPQYSQGPKQDYWNSWSSSLIEIKPMLTRAATLSMEEI